MNFQDHLNGFSKMRDETRSSSSGNRSHSSRSCGNRPISHAATNKPRADHNIDQKYHDFLNGVKETNKQPTQQRRRARYATGGHVALTKNNAERLAKQGRFGDTKLAKVGTLTAKLMDGLVHGGHKQINPKTGLREYAFCPNCGGDIETCSCKDPEFYKQQNINKNNNPVLTQEFMPTSNNQYDWNHLPKLEREALQSYVKQIDHDENLIKKFLRMYEPLKNMPKSKTTAIEKYSPIGIKQEGSDCSMLGAYNQVKNFNQHNIQKMEEYQERTGAISRTKGRTGSIEKSHPIEKFSKRPKSLETPKTPNSTEYQNQILDTFAEPKEGSEKAINAYKDFTVNAFYSNKKDYGYYNPITHLQKNNYKTKYAPLYSNSLQNRQTPYKETQRLIEQNIVPGWGLQADLNKFPNQNSGHYILVPSIKERNTEKSKKKYDARTDVMNNVMHEGFPCDSIRSGLRDDIENKIQKGDLVKVMPYKMQINDPNYLETQNVYGDEEKLYKYNSGNNSLYEAYPGTPFFSNITSIEP